MLAELDHVAGRRARWGFALGAARAVLAPARSRQLAAMALAAAAAGVVIRVLLPGAGLTAAVAIPGLPALCAWVALAMPDPPPAASAGRAAQVIAVAAILACPVLALREIGHYPGQAGSGAVSYAGPVMTVMFAAELGACLLLVLRRPALLGAGRNSGLPGLAAALAAGWVLAASQPPAGQSGSPVLTTAVAATVLGALLSAGALGALPGLALHRGLGPSLRAGVGELLWGVLLSVPAAFIAVLLTTSRSAIAAEAGQPVFISEASRQGATSIMAWIAHDDLGGAVVMFTVLSAVAAVIFAIAHTLFPSPGEPPEPLPAASTRNSRAR
jgi:hypothetical protein